MTRTHDPKSACLSLGHRHRNASRYWEKAPEERVLAESDICHSACSFNARVRRMPYVFSYLIRYFPLLTLKAPITTAADGHLQIFCSCFTYKIRLGVSSESSAGQRIHIKNQALFSSKDKSTKLKCRLLQFCLAL